MNRQQRRAFGKERVEVKIDFTRNKEIFTHVDSDTNDIHIFAVDVMNEFAATYGGMIQQVVCKNLVITEDHVDVICKMRGIEPDRVDRLTPAYRDMPIIAVEMDDGTTLFVDGNHRFVRRHRDGFTNIKAFIFKDPFWKNFLINHLLPAGVVSIIAKYAIDNKPLPPMVEMLQMANHEAAHGL